MRNRHTSGDSPSHLEGPYPPSNPSLLDNPCENNKNDHSYLKNYIELCSSLCITCKDDFDLQLDVSYRGPRITAEAMMGSPCCCEITHHRL